MSDRKIEDLSPVMQEKCKAWCAQMDTVGNDYLITCTRRTQAEQQVLYNQGRTAPGPIVTWILQSKHLTGDAFDFVIMFGGKPDWSMFHKTLWQEAIDIGKGLGLTQVIGKDGHIKEYAHLQVA
jgi:peptidoglycan LD-endopeptidase CwlK